MGGQEPARPRQSSRFRSEIDLWIDKKLGATAVNGYKDSGFDFEWFRSGPRHGLRQIVRKLKHGVRLPVDSSDLQRGQETRRVDSVSFVDVWVGNVKTTLDRLASKHHPPTKTVFHKAPFASARK